MKKGTEDTETTSPQGTGGQVLPTPNKPDTAGNQGNRAGWGSGGIDVCTDQPEIKGPTGFGN